MRRPMNEIDLKNTHTHDIYLKDAKSTFSAIYTDELGWLMKTGPKDYTNVYPVAWEDGEPEPVKIKPEVGKFYEFKISETSIVEQGVYVQHGWMVYVEETDCFIYVEHNGIVGHVIREIDKVKRSNKHTVCGFSLQDLRDTRNFLYRVTDYKGSLLDLIKTYVPLSHRMTPQELTESMIRSMGRSEHWNRR